MGLCLLVLGCGFEPDGEVAFEPPPVYHEWWGKTQTCSGQTGDFERVSWFVIEGRGFDCPGGECAGHWEDDHSIYLASDWMMNEMVVRHEILHELLGRSGHPDPPFGRGCALTWDTWSGAVIRFPERIDPQ